MLKADLCVIGAGAAGLSVAAGAVQLGLSVILVEKGDMGGECLNRGCVPSKAMLSVAKKGGTYRQAQAHIRHAIHTIAPHDSQERFEALGCTVIREAVKFIDKRTLETAGGQTVRARRFVIAAGSRPAIPDIKGLKADKVLTADTIFTLEEKPAHLAIIGGGPVGVEMAQAHVKLGCRVTLITDETILPHDDPDCVEIIRRQLKADGVTLYEKAAITAITMGKEPKIKTATDTVTASHILVATGRTPNTDTLNLKAAKIRHDKNGIFVNQRLQTNRRHIYAVGDIVRKSPRFTHIAGYHAGIVIRNICFRLRAKTDYRTLPWVTYTSPELAHVGLTEKEALKKYGKDNIRVIAKGLAGNDRAVTEGIEGGLMKLVGKTDGTILGVSVVADNAGEMLALWSLAISKNMKMNDVAGLILPYPTFSEISKSIAGEWYKDALFSERTRLIVRLLQKLPSF